MSRCREARARALALHGGLRVLGFWVSGLGCKGLKFRGFRI